MKVQEYDIEDAKILINNSEKEITISDLLIWLDQSGKLNWINDFNDPGQSNGHGQASGKYHNFDEYLDSTSEEDFISDLQEYLNEKHPEIIKDTDKIVDDFFETIEAICKPSSQD